MTDLCPVTLPGKYGTTKTCSLEDGHDGPHMEVLFSPGTGRPMFTHEWSKDAATTG